MQPVQRPGEQLTHTGRYKPSKELVQLTKRKMDESEAMIKRLESRLANSNQTAEKKAIEERLRELKRQYVQQVEELQVQKESEAPVLPRVAEPKKANIDQVVAETQQLTGCDCAYQPTMKTGDMCCSMKNSAARNVLAGQSILERRAGNSGTMGTGSRLTKWSQIQKEHIEDARRVEEEQLAHFEKVKQQYKKDIQYQVAPIDYVKDHKVQVLKTRPKSPTIYQDSTFVQIGASDLKRKENALIEKQKLNEMFITQCRAVEERKAQEKALARSTKDIDLDKMGLPCDRFDETGKVKKTAVPDKFLQGQTFSNQEKKAPGYASKARIHGYKEQQEKLDLAEEQKLIDARESRDAATIRAREDKVQRQLAIQENVYDDFKRVRNTQRGEKYGSFPYKDEDEIAHGNFYQTVNRRVKPQPDAHKDPVYMEGNFIERIDAADKKRRNRESNVAPLTEEERQQIEERRRLAKMPQKAPLDECDVTTIRNYIADAQETLERGQKRLEAQKKYNEELQEFQRAKKAVDPDDLNQAELAMMAAPRMVKAPF